MRWVRAVPVLLVLLFWLGSGILSCTGTDSTDSTGNGSNNSLSADAGPDQTAVFSAFTTLDGSHNSNPDGDQYTFRRAFVAIPDGSIATLSDPTGEHPTLIADVVGVYTISLVVNGGSVDSAPDTVTAPGPSLVSMDGRQLIVQKRHPDGTLGRVLPYVIRGVVWSPASQATNTSLTDPNNANVRRLGDFRKRSSYDRVGILKGFFRNEPPDSTHEVQSCACWT